MLQISNLTAKVDSKTIINNLNLTIHDGEIHVLMGQNGVGKSTICKILLRNDDYQITEGSILYNNHNLVELNTTDVARLGMYLINQSPMQIEGVSNAEMLRTALFERKNESVNIFEFSKKLEDICKELNFSKDFIHKDINVGASGGERKKTEMLHMWVLEPNFIILDEVDSGLDVDALKVVGNSLKKYYLKYKPSILIITHHNKILEYLKPDYVHILKNGYIIKSGDKSLAKEIEKKGFSYYDEAKSVSEIKNEE